MAARPLRCLWRVADQLDYLVTLAWLRILDALAGPLAGDAGPSAATTRSGEDKQGFSQDRAVKSRACQSAPCRSAKIQRAIKRAGIANGGGFSSALAHSRKTG
jgi:hypothetical protein